MPFSFMPTEAPSVVRNFSSAVFLFSVPRSSSVTVHAKTGATFLLEACCTALAVTASTAPLKNSISSWPVTLRERFSRTIVCFTISSSVNLGMVSSTDGAAAPPRPAGMAVIEKPPVSGPHLDFRLRAPPSAPGDLERFLSFFFFFSFLPSLEAERFSFLILSFFFFFDFDRSRFTLGSDLTSPFTLGSDLARAYKSASMPSPFTPYSPLTSRFTPSSFSSLSIFSLLTPPSLLT
mmetsp:Transcript_6033/g.17771  ORF Transcript_6033/g.17771 Transcript_6033/m.17771 type:complete len:235 (+) Transcript_6033:917-1621(+)